MSPGAGPPLEAKVAFLRRRDAYPGSPARIEAVETHMAWVFLSGEYAYKLKKPVRYDFLDFSTLAARRLDCEEELRLNRRLAPGVYLDMVALALAPGGNLALGGSGEPVDWLVRMRRLPAHLMLDQAIRARTASATAVRRSVAALAAFYRGCTPEPMTAAAYRQRYADGARAACDELADPWYRLPAALVREIAAEQLVFLERHAGLLDRRVAEQRIVEGHGDLRPEHVCLSDPPVFIDCLEFNRDWRLVDPADEIAYLALECEHAGAPDIGEAALAAYGQETDDDPPQPLIRFYKSYRASVRAKLAAWHLRDHPDEAAQRKWDDHARRYLDLARRYADNGAMAEGPAGTQA